MDKLLNVKDKYRTNPLSLTPGGEIVTVTYSSGNVFVYDKIKKPGLYIKSIENRNKQYGKIVEILLNGKMVWDVTFTIDPWQI